MIHRYKTTNSTMNNQDNNDKHHRRTAYTHCIERRQRGMATVVRVHVLHALLCLLVCCCCSSSSIILHCTALTPSSTNNNNHNNINNINNKNTRRKMLQQMLTPPSTALLLTTTSTMVSPRPANAALPMSTTEADNTLALFYRKTRPPPSKLLRPSLTQPFAVLLMRCSYNAMDELDCVAMDQFQRDFFLIRQAEYQYYVDSVNRNSNGGLSLVKQGVLTDAFYFDFISFAQYATIARDVTQAPEFFEEQQLVTSTSTSTNNDDKDEGDQQTWKSVVIRRDPSLQLNSADQLLSAHSRMVGTGILQYLRELYGGTTSALPDYRTNLADYDNRPNVKNPVMMRDALQQLVNLFLINGFALDGKVSMSSNYDNDNDKNNKSTRYEIVLTSPATLWSGRALEYGRSKVRNAFVCKAAVVLLEEAGYRVVGSKEDKDCVKYSKTEEITVLTVSC